MMRRADQGATWACTDPDHCCEFLRIFRVRSINDDPFHAAIPSYCCRDRCGAEDTGTVPGTAVSACSNRLARMLQSRRRSGKGPRPMARCALSPDICAHLRELLLLVNGHVVDLLPARVDALSSECQRLAI